MTANAKHSELGKAMRATTKWPVPIGVEHPNWANTPNAFELREFLNKQSAEDLRKTRLMYRIEDGMHARLYGFFIDTGTGASENGEETTDYVF